MADAFPKKNKAEVPVQRGVTSYYKDIVTETVWNPHKNRQNERRKQIPKEALGNKISLHFPIFL